MTEVTKKPPRQTSPYELARVCFAAAKGYRNRMREISKESVRRDRALEQEMSQQSSHTSDSSTD